jgi:hypothetical protein
MASGYRTPCSICKKIRQSDLRWQDKIATLGNGAAVLAESGSARGSQYMAISQASIIESIARACAKLDPHEFIFSFLEAYGFPKSTITRLRNGGDSRNVASGDDIGLKKKLYFRVVPADVLHFDKSQPQEYVGSALLRHLTTCCGELNTMATDSRRRRPHSVTFLAGERGGRHSDLTR